MDKLYENECVRVSYWLSYSVSAAWCRMRGGALDDTMHLIIDLASWCRLPTFGYGPKPWPRISLTHASSPTRTVSNTLRAGENDSNQ